MSDTRNKWCRSCEDAIETFKRKGKDFDPSPFCKGCWQEKHEGKIPRVTNTKPRISQPTLDDTGPWQDNAIRDMES